MCFQEGVPSNLVGNDAAKIRHLGIEIIEEIEQATTDLQILVSAEQGSKSYGIRLAMLLAKGQLIGYPNASNKTPVEKFDEFLSQFNIEQELLITPHTICEMIVEQKYTFFPQMELGNFTIFMHLILGLHDIIDMQYGFKLLQCAVARTVWSYQVTDGYMYDYDVEVLYLSRQFGYRIEQIPIRCWDDNVSGFQLLSGKIRSVKISGACDKTQRCVVLLPKHLLSSKQGNYEMFCHWRSRVHRQYPC